MHRTSALGVLGPVLIVVFGCALPVSDLDRNLDTDPVELPALDPADLVAPTSQTTGSLNTRYQRSEWVYRDGESCYVRQYGTANESVPLLRVRCPEAMADPVWKGCVDGQIYRDELGQCTCHQMGQPDGHIPRPAGVLATLCPGPPLVDDVITTPPPGHVGLLNPQSARHGTLYRDRDGSCIVDGPLPPGSRRPSGSCLYALAVACPEAMFEGCVRGRVSRLADQQCTCVRVEGDPPRDRPRRVPCP